MIRKYIKYIWYIIIFATSITINSTAIAGFSGGPYAIWVNLSGNAEMDRIIGDQFDERGRCMYPDAILFMRDRPRKITNSLVKKALINQDKKSIKLLSSLMHKPYQDLDKGFDGVIAYTDLPSPRFIRLSTGDPITAEKYVKLPTAEDSIWSAFCILMPQISRNP